MNGQLLFFHVRRANGSLQRSGLPEVELEDQTLKATRSRAAPSHMSMSTVEATLSVIMKAHEVDPHTDAIALWVSQVEIAELGGLTAAQLISMGKSQSVLAFLDEVKRGLRD